MAECEAINSKISRDVNRSHWIYPKELEGRVVKNLRSLKKLLNLKAGDYIWSNPKGNSIEYWRYHMGFFSLPAAYKCKDCNMVSIGPPKMRIINQIKKNKVEYLIHSCNNCNSIFHKETYYTN